MRLFTLVCAVAVFMLTGQVNGNTLIADSGNNRVIEVDSSGIIVWEKGGLYHPVDAERLANGNTLIADASNLRVIEVNSSGSVVWEKTGLVWPWDAQRLANGNTLIADFDRVIEVNSSGSVVWEKTGLLRPAAAKRLANGNTLVAEAGNARVVEVNSSGSVVWEKTGLNWPWDAERLSNGNTLIAESDSSRVIEVSISGTVVWEMSGLDHPRGAERLANGNTLIADVGNDRVIEVNSSGTIVWEKTGLNGPWDAERVLAEGPPPSPQAAKVAYHSYSSYDNWDSRLYLLDLEVQEGKWISDDWNTVDHAMNAHFDPNGNRIVFMAVPKGEHEGSAWELYLWTIDSGEPVRLTDNGVRDEDPKFSPDGKWIVFKRGGRIHKMKAQPESGTNIPERVTNNSFEESMPYYTKDGTRRILYMSGAKSNADIRIVDEKGKTNDRYVANASVSGIQEYYPIAWYDDTFLYARWYDSANHNDQIYSCDISSGHIESLAINTGYENANNSDAYPMNRDYILFSSTRSGSNYELFIGNVHTGEFWPITVYGGVNTTNEELGSACWPANISSEILVTLASHADLHVYDPEGRHTGIDYITNTVVEGIPGSEFKILDEAGNEVPYDGHTPGEGLRQVISLPEIQAGTYRIEIIGTSEGPFRLTVSGIQDGYTLTSQSYEGDIVKGARLSTNVEMVSVLDGLTLIWEGQFSLQLEAVIDFEPDTLNLESQGKSVTAYIELPKGFDASDIGVSSLMLNGSVPALSKPSEVGDYDEDGIADLMAKFGRHEVAEVLEPGVQMVVLTGQLNDGTPLAGFDFVRVIGSIMVEATEPEFDLSVPLEVAGSQDKPATIEADEPGTVVSEAFDVKEGIAFMLSEACQTISELGPESFDSEESVVELTTTIDAMFTMLDDGLYFEALAVLDNDILQRTDGCANTGQPDQDDWITSIEGQTLVYPLVVEMIELLESLI